MKTLDQLRQKRSEIEAVAERHGARRIRVFGSVARGEDREDSDIDLLVEFSPGTSLLTHVGLVHALEDLLGRTVEIASERGLRPRYRDRILGEAVLL